MSNPSLITSIVSVVLLILAIFGANWINLRFIEKLMDQQTKAVKDLVEQQTKTIDAKLDTVNARIAGVDQRIGGVEQRLERLERQFDFAFKPTLSHTGD